MTDRAEEFDCVECGLPIVRIIPQPTVPKLCHLCLAFPGWCGVPELRRIYDPDGLAKPEKL